MPKKIRKKLERNRKAPNQLTHFLDRMAQAKGMDQADIARATGLDATHVNHIFQGRTMGIDTLKTIANALGLKRGTPERAHLKDMWNEVKWGETSLSGEPIDKDLRDRLDELERKLLSLFELMRKKEVYSFVAKNGYSENTAKLIVSNTALTVGDALTGVNALARVIVEIQDEIAILKEKLVRQIHEAQGREKPTIQKPMEPMEVDPSLQLK